MDAIPLTHLGLSLFAGSLTTLSPGVFPILPLVIGGAVRGGIILGLFGIGAAIPLVAVPYASRSGFNAARGWILQRIDGIRKAFGIFILLTGIAILSGADKWLEARIVAILPDTRVGATTLF
jgi:cytochrome c-type biogenesis protein